MTSHCRPNTETRSKHAIEISHAGLRKSATDSHATSPHGEDPDSFTYRTIPGLPDSTDSPTRPGKSLRHNKEPVVSGDTEVKRVKPFELRSVQGSLGPAMQTWTLITLHLNYLHAPTAYNITALLSQVKCQCLHSVGYETLPSTASTVL